MTLDLLRPKAREELSAAARGSSLTTDRIFGVLKRISTFAASAAIAAVVVAYSDAVTVTGLLIIMFADGLLLQMVHIFREEIFPEQACPWQYKLIKFYAVLLFTSTKPAAFLLLLRTLTPITDNNIRSSN